MEVGSFTEQRERLIAEYRNVYSLWQSAVDSGDTGQIGLYDSWVDIEQKIHVLECEHIEKTIGKVIKKVVFEILQDINEAQTLWKEQELLKLSDLRKKGVSYQEREKLVNMGRLERLARCLKTAPKSMSGFELNPVCYWLPPIVGYDRLKLLGITEFARRNLFLMIKE